MYVRGAWSGIENVCVLVIVMALCCAVSIVDVLPCGHRAARTSSLSWKLQCVIVHCVRGVLCVVLHAVWGLAAVQLRLVPFDKEGPRKDRHMEEEREFRGRWRRRQGIAVISPGAGAGIRRRLRTVTVLARLRKES